MGIKLSQSVSSYRLLFFSPEPEAEERVCIGLLFTDGRSRTVLCDDNFPKVRCIAPKFELSLLRFFVRDMEGALRDSDEPVEIVLGRYAPHIQASTPRSLLVPVTSTLQERLLCRFVSLKCKKSAEYVDGRARFQHEVREWIKSAVHPYPDTKIITNARPSDLGIRAKFGAVAFAVLAPKETLLIDGIDVGEETRPRILNSVGRIAHTFWQYGRIQSDEDRIKYRLSSAGIQVKFRRVAVVLNRSGIHNQKVDEDCEFALHQLGAEADQTIDGRVEPTDQRLAELVMGRE